MFLVASSKSATDSYSQAAPVGLHIIGAENTTYGTIIPIERSRLGLLTTVLVKEDAVVSERIITFDAGKYSNNLVSVKIGSNNYSPASDRDNIQPGEYSFDFVTNQVQVYLLVGDNLEKDSLVYQTGVDTGSLQNKSTDICAASEPLLAKWNAKDSISINYRFGSEPSGLSFSFTSCQQEIPRIKQELANGTEHNCLDYKWVVSSLQIVEESYTDIIGVVVNLTYFLASRGNPSQSVLDKPIKLKKKLGGNTYKRVVKSGELALDAGASYRGEEIRVRVPRSTSVKEFTTMRSLVQERAITNHGYVYYGREGIEVRQWSEGKTHIINESDLRDRAITINYQGQGSWLNGVQLSSELRNIKINLDFDEDADNQQGVYQEWTFENCDNLSELYRPVYRSGFFLQNPDTEILRSPLINFDSGGAFNKSATRTTYVNNTPTFEEKIETGYCFSTGDGISDNGLSFNNNIYRVNITSQGNIKIELNPTANPQNFFGVVRQTTSDWIFDSDDGYLEEIRIRGFEKARLQQESEQLEGITLKAQAIQQGSEVNGIFTPDPSLMAQAKAYEFSENLEIIDTTIYGLDRHRDYYDDVVQPDECEEEDFIEPKFVRLMARSRDDFFIRENPKNTEQFTYPPITTGKRHRESERVSIKSDRFPEKYQVTSKKETIEGESFKNANRESSIDYRDGKPGVHTRLDLSFDPLNNSTNTNYEQYKNENYYLFSSGVVFDDIKVEEGSKGYPDIDDPNQVRAIAQTEQSIKNSQNACTTTINIHYRTGIEVGDFVLFRGQRWKVFGINDSRTLDIKRQKSDRFELSLGLYLRPKLQVENRNSCSGSSTLTVPPAIIIEDPVVTIPPPNYLWAFEDNLNQSDN